MDRLQTQRLKLLETPLPPPLRFPQLGNAHQEMTEPALTAFRGQNLKTLKFRLTRIQILFDLSSGLGKGQLGLEKQITASGFTI